MLPDSDVSRILVVTAHPDDVDFGAAGTVAGWTDAGIEVSYAILTSGDAGEAFPGTPRSEVGALREGEQLAAAKAVGVSDVRFLRHKDGSLVPTLELRKEIVRQIRQVRPDRMLIQSPERWWERIYASHPDHLAAGESAMQAVYPDARNPYAFPDLLAEEGLEPWTVKEVWVMAHPASAHVVDVTDTFDRKLTALQAHASQTGNHPDLEGMLRTWGGGLAERFGLPAGRLAEVFYVLNTE